MFLLLAPFLLAPSSQPGVLPEVSAFEYQARDKDPELLDSSIKIDVAACNNDVLAVEECIRQDPNAVNYRDSDNRTPLHYAAGHGSIDVVKILLDNGANIDVQTKAGVTSLRWAYEFRRFDTFEYLLKAGANTELCSWDRQREVWPNGHDYGNPKLTALSNALCDNVPDEYIFAMLDAKADPNAATPETHWTPIAWAAYFRRDDAVFRALIQHGAYVDPINLQGNTPIASCFLSSDPSQAKILLDAGASTAIVGNVNDHWHDNCKMNLMGWAARGGSLDCVYLAAAYGAALNQMDGEGRDPKTIAIIHNHLDLVKPLEKLIEEASRGYTPAHFAVQYHYKEAFAVLKRRGFSLDGPDDQGVTPLMLSASMGDLECCDYLIKSGANVKATDRNGDTALHLAARNSSSGLISLLLAAGASANAKNASGESPASIANTNGNQIIQKMLGGGVTAQESASGRLHRALEHNDDEVALQLLASDPTLSTVRYGKSWTALHYAAYFGSTRVMTALIEKGADVNARTDSGWTPLMLAVQQKQPAVLAQLIQLKANVNARATNGRTALHVAAQENNSASIPVLLKAGANRSLKDSSGATPLMIATQLGNTAAVAALKAAK